MLSAAPDRPLLAAVQAAGTDGFIGAVNDRTDTEWVEVTPETRDELPAVLEGRLIQAIESS